MKMLILLTLFLTTTINSGLSLPKEEKSFQTPDYCFIHTANYVNKVAYVSPVLDPEDFDGTGWDIKKIKIKDAAKAALNIQVGSTAYEYTLGLAIEDKDSNGIFTNKYDADKYQQKIIKDYKSKGYTVITLNVEE